jgi:hypothetical protein
MPESLTRRKTPPTWLVAGFRPGCDHHRPVLISALIIQAAVSRDGTEAGTSGPSSASSTDATSTIP